jgi:hypothetical protein
VNSQSQGRSSYYQSMEVIMQCSCVHKTSDGKRKTKGKRKPVAVKNAKAKRDSLLRKLMSR